jgi:hypothetical protein
MRVRTCAAAVLVAIAASVAAVAAQASSVPPLSSLRTLAAPAKLPPDYIGEIGRTAAHVGITATTAVARTRMLLSNVTGLPLYAFGGKSGQVCFVVWRGGGTCGVLGTTRDSLWIVNGGSRKRGQAVVGVVSDGVRAVVVTLGSRTVRATVRHNAFVVPFRTEPGTPAPMAAVRTIR